MSNVLSLGSGVSQVGMSCRWSFATQRMGAQGFDLRELERPANLLSVEQIKSSFISGLVTCRANCFMV